MVDYCGGGGGFGRRFIVGYPTPCFGVRGGVCDVGIACGAEGGVDGVDVFFQFLFTLFAELWREVVLAVVFEYDDYALHP